MSQPESTESRTKVVHVECGFYIRDHATNGDCPMLLSDYMDTQKPGLVTFTRDQLVSTPERKAGVRPGVVAEVREYPAPEVGLAEGVYTPAMAEQVEALQRAHGPADKPNDTDEPTSVIGASAATPPNNLPAEDPCPANVPVVDPARVAMYAEAILAEVRQEPSMPGYERLALAVVAVADAELAELRAEVERLRDDTDIVEADLREVESDARTQRERAEAAEAKVAAVEQAVERRSKLHARWNGVQELVVSVVDLQAAMVAASPDGGGLVLSDEEFAGFQAAVNDEPVTGLDGRLHGPDGPGSPSCTCGNVYGSVERLSGHLVWAASRLAEGGE